MRASPGWAEGAIPGVENLRQAAARRAARSPSGCVLLDEWQDVPDVLSTVKRLVDRGVKQIVMRDFPELGRTRDGSALRRLLRAIAENTAGITADAQLATAVGADVKTVRRNKGFFDDLRIVTAVPAWYSNRISRLVKSRKRYVVDTGLATAVLGVDDVGILADGGLLGRLLDTFVLAQLRPLLEVGTAPVGIHHLRQQDGRREIDVVLERADGRVCGIEIKAGSAPNSSDARHLAWLRDGIGDRFAAGIVLHTGPSSYPLGERIVACPIAALWG